MYRWELGRINSNRLGVTATPISTGGLQAYHDARVAQYTMEHWVKEADVPGFYDAANQHLLYYGQVAYLRYMDRFRQQVYLKAVPGPELFPIPYDATTWEECHGIMRVALVTEEFLEQQDELYKVQNQRDPEKPMKKAVSNQSVKMHQHFTGFASNSDWAGSVKGATGIWIWMKPTPQQPHGEHAFMLEDELYRYVAGQGPDGKSAALFNGKIPLEPVYYIKKPDDFWGTGFCETLIAPQMEANRQMNAILKSANMNTGFLGYNSDLVDPKDIHNNSDGLVPFRSPGYEERIAPLIHFPPQNVGRDVGAVMQIVDSFYKRAAGYESEVIFGKQEGRTETGPATNILHSNAQVPLQVVMERIYRAFERTYPEVLDMIKEVWPPEKQLRIQGPRNIGRSILLRKENLPTSNKVMLSPTPLMPNGKNEMMNLIFQLRGMIGQDGRPELSSSEFRKALTHLNMTPPGLKLIDDAEERIQWRIDMLIGDGQTPQIQPASPQQPQLQYENHEMASAMLRKALLDPAFEIYGPNVKKALVAEFQFHDGFAPGKVYHPDQFDDDQDNADARRMEDELFAQELSPDIPDGEFTIDGIPVGI